MSSAQDIYYYFAILGALATTTSLIYLFIKDYRKSRKISELEKVAFTLKKDLELKYQPHLWINGVQLRNLENKINFDLNNKREWCELLDIRITSGDLIVDEINRHLPYELEPKFSPDILSETHRRYLFFINNTDKPLSECEYVYEIIYRDRLKTKYFIIVSGQGEKFRVSEPKVK